MAELVHENVRRPHAVGGDRAVQAENAAAAVRRAVHQDFDDVVRRVGDEVAKRLVLEREHVAFRVERIVRRTGRRSPVDALRRPRHAGLGGRRTQAPHVDVALAFLERRRGEQHGGEPPGIAFELASFGSRVAVTQDQEIELLRRIAAHVHLDPRAGVSRPDAALDEFVRRIDRHRPPSCAPSGAQNKDKSGALEGRKNVAQGASPGKLLFSSRIRFTLSSTHRPCQFSEVPPCSPILRRWS